MYGKRSNPVPLIFISMIFYTTTALQLQTLLLHHDPPTAAPSEGAAAQQNSQNYLSLELAHKPYHSSSLSRSEIVNSRLKRDLWRVQSLSRCPTQPHNANSSVFSGFSLGIGEYLTRLGVGTPPVYMDMLLDTGSDITWLQCAPCEKCYKQVDPIFNPNNSKWYQDLGCGSIPCKQLNSHFCNRSTNKCQYEVRYGDGSSFTTGDFSNETLTLQGNRLNGIFLGCGHHNEGPSLIGYAGLLGLGRGNLSFPNQVGHLYGREFSYCLVSSDSNDTSPILFGDIADVWRKSNVTKMLSNRLKPTFYYVNLTGISVDGSRVQGITPSIFEIKEDGSGGVVIDSGTTITLLEKSAYVALKKAFRKGSSKLKLKLAPSYSMFDTCYDFSKGEVGSEVSVPSVNLHFDGGVDMQLPGDNYLIPVDDNGRYCFTCAASNGFSVIGNILQQGFRVSFDLDRKRIGLVPTSC